MKPTADDSESTAPVDQVEAQAGADAGARGAEPRRADPAAESSLELRLAALPSEPLDGRVAASVRRRARAVFERERARPHRHPQWARASRAWAGSVLPAFLLACAVVYVWGSMHVIEQVYLAGGG